MSPSVLSPLAWDIFLLAVVVSIFLGLILAYHWFTYAQNKAASLTALIIYGMITFFLLSGLLTATIFIAHI